MAHVYTACTATLAFRVYDTSRLGGQNSEMNFGYTLSLCSSTASTVFQTSYVRIRLVYPSIHLQSKRARQTSSVRMCVCVCVCVRARVRVCLCVCVGGIAADGVTLWDSLRFNYMYIYTYYILCTEIYLLFVYIIYNVHMSVKKKKR